MKRTSIWAVSLMAPAILLCSCDDKERLQKEAALQQELSRLEGEVSSMETQLRTAPKDRSQELDTLTKKLESVDSEIAQQEAKVSDVRQREAALKADFEAYKSANPIR